MAKQVTHKIYVSLVTVTGSGAFPYDMLRYDSCFPATESDSGRMFHDWEDRAPRTVKLKRYSLTTNGPTEGRWNSFGWTIVNTEIVT